MDAALLSPPQPQQGPSGAGASTAPVTSPKKKKYQLSSAADSLLAQIRDENFAVVGVKLNREARRIDTELKVRRMSFSLVRPVLMMAVLFREGIKLRLLHSCEISLGGWVVCRTSSRTYDSVRAVLYSGSNCTPDPNCSLDTELSEEISAFTRTDVFNKSLEIQQSPWMSRACNHAGR